MGDEGDLDCMDDDPGSGTVEDNESKDCILRIDSKLVLARSVNIGSEQRKMRFLTDSPLSKR